MGNTKRRFIVNDLEEVPIPTNRTQKRQRRRYEHRPTECETNAPEYINNLKETTYIQPVEDINSDTRDSSSVSKPVSSVSAGIKKEDPGITLSASIVSGTIAISPPTWQKSIPVQPPPQVQSLFKLETPSQPSSRQPEHKPQPPKIDPRLTPTIPPFTPTIPPFTPTIPPLTPTFPSPILISSPSIPPPHPIPPPDSPKSTAAPQDTPVKPEPDAISISLDPISDPDFMGCSEALRLEKRLAAHLAALRFAAASVENDDSLKRRRKDINKELNVHVQQITATWEQINRKTGDIREWWRKNSEQLSSDASKDSTVNNIGWRPFILLTLAQKFINQCESIERNQSIVFPLAEVIGDVADVDHIRSISSLLPTLPHSTITAPNSEMPDAIKEVIKSLQLDALIPTLLGLLQEKTHLAVPKGRKLGSQNVKNNSGAFLDGSMMLYGAVVQKVDIAFMWTYLTWTLKARMPIVSALGRAASAVLKIGGYELYSRYGNTFETLIRLIGKELLKPLEEQAAKNDSDAELSKVVTTLKSYIDDEKYKEEPI
eukprot:CAMPEP_0175068328 /NCGR_PEP_ID=MMETSP0052_2-20121109/17614_1 /TAXON_ID=51329 ORGANISM="Polytomella parva, Strain SAG 63-3" /NCGR_SAMPLE_ID=MMETSP0052_2 /ASSEMBLY_ACC=CAM_ASM_000194 /LENGTH=542 /DNA_ID=CAMNT_0016335351 /DNA_START=116 /DNA_END=1741 /DNA_ORIENTATION=+